MDLNASPVPEDDEQPIDGHIPHALFAEDHQESAVQISRREREERRLRMKRGQRDEAPKRHSQPTNHDYTYQNRNVRPCGSVKQLPQGWLDCPSHGQCIGCMVPSKVPLDETYNESIIPGKRYSSKQAIHQQKRAGREIFLNLDKAIHKLTSRQQLGVVIDLTNSDLYYSPSEWVKQGIKHVKIACKGRGAVPDNESVNIFFREVRQFLNRHKRSRKYILVHCTHGHNRTGFMIVHFLMRSHMASHVAEAIHIFSQARPLGIYKKDYIEALYTFYQESRDNLVCPSTPEWKRTSDLDLNGDAVGDDEDDGDGAARSHDNIEARIITNEDVLGDAVPYDQQDAMRQICNQLLFTHSGKGNDSFSGSHPVSLDRKKLKLLRQRYYYATWKADGTRYMMLIATHGCYLIDRNFSFRRVQLRFPLKNTNEGFHHLTLIDGEMIIDKLPDNQLKRRYLAYDLAALNSHSVVKLPFSERWKLLEEEVIRPRNFEKKQFECEGRCNPAYRYDMEPFGVRRKDFWLLYTVGKLLKEFIKKLSHEADGLIFQGWDDPYVPLANHELLKWKYPSMNSVDFLFEVGTDGRELLFIFERGKKKLMEGARVILGDECKDIEDISSLSGKIIECSCDPESKSWVCMRVRSDKDTPNDIKTYRNVMRSINDNITEEVILEEIEEIVQLPMYADRIAKAHQQQKRRLDDYQPSVSQLSFRGRCHLGLV